MADLPKVVDLIAIARALQERDPDNKLAKAVQQARRVQSCIADVSLAATTLEALAQLVGAQAAWAPEVHQVAAQHALLANAIILYARATATSAKWDERGHTPIRDRLSSDDQVAHDRIIAVRNTALAHVRANEAIADEFWHRETVFAVEDEEGAWLPAAVTRRVQANPNLADILRRLLPTAEALLKETYHRRINFVAAQLNATPDTGGLFESCTMDPIKFFGTEAEAEAALRRCGPGAKAYGVIRG